MVDDVKRKQLEDMLADMTPEDFRQIDEHVLGFLKDRVEREDTPLAQQGTAKDSAVQRLAVWAIQWHRDPRFRKMENRRFDPDEVVSYETLGERAKVSRARIHMLVKTLTPHLYEETARVRRTG